MQRRFYAVNGELKFESRSVLIYCAFSLPLFSRWLKVSKEAQHLPFFFPPTDNESRFLFRKINSPIKSTRLVVAVSILLLSLSICFNSKVAQQLQKIQCPSLPKPTKYISWLSQKGTYVQSNWLHFTPSTPEVYKYFTRLVFVRMGRRIYTHLYLAVLLPHTLKMLKSLPDFVALQYIRDRCRN